MCIFASRKQFWFMYTQLGSYLIIHAYSVYPPPTHTHTHIFIRPLHTHTHSPAHHTHTQSRAPAHHTHTHSPAHTTHTQSCSEGMDELTGRLTELLKELDQLGSQMMEFRNGLKEQVDSILTAPHSPSPPTENLIDFTIKHT